MKNEKNKKTPMRMCVVCKQMMPKSNLLRIVVNKDSEIFIDKIGKANGRGAYVCDNLDCISTCVKKKVLNRVFKCEISDEIYARILENYAEKSGN